MPGTGGEGKPAVASGTPTVAIVGRPNVGKSTLFNRIVRQRQAIVEDIPGTTRDRLYAQASWKDRSFAVIDTGGLEPEAEEGYSPLIREQVEIAVTEAEVILFIVDVLTGVTEVDREIAEYLRRADKPVLLVANKADNEGRGEAAIDFYELGMGEPMIISAYHDVNVRELLDATCELLPEARAEAPEDTVRIAIVGRPNVGKSALINAILGRERVIVSEMAGTTRDAIDTPFEYEGHPMVLVDTAGIRRRGKVERGVEKYSVMRARDALERCDVAVLVLDAPEMVRAQDTHIAGYVAEAHKGMIVAANKWDLMEDDDKERKDFVRKALYRLKFVPWAPLAFVSAKTGLNVDGLLDLALEVQEARSVRVPTHELNSLVRQVVAAHPPPAPGKHPVRVKYVTQPEIRPPTFVFFVNDARLLHFSYRRYLENALRKRFGFEGTAIKLEFRSRRE
jgi:GTP-binding protein